MTRLTLSLAALCAALAFGVWFLWDMTGDLRTERNEALEARDAALRGQAAVTEALRYQEQAAAHLQDQLDEILALEGADEGLSPFERAVLDSLRDGQ